MNYLRVFVRWVFAALIGVMLSMCSDSNKIVTVNDLDGDSEGEADNANSDDDETDESNVEDEADDKKDDDDGENDNSDAPDNGGDEDEDDAPDNGGECAHTCMQQWRCQGTVVDGSCAQEAQVCCDTGNSDTGAEEDTSPDTGADTGAPDTGGNTSEDPCSMTTPLSGGTEQCSTNAWGDLSDGYSWTIWSDGSGSAGCITPYDVDAAFSARWNNSGDFLARVGIQWDSTKTYDQYGTISADFAETKTGSAGGVYSYVGIYGWSQQPTIEWYIIDDWIDANRPIPGNKVGEITVDGGKYDVLTQTRTGASIDNSPSWEQFWSLRQERRSCGHISITEHFKAWEDFGLVLGKMYEAKILVEAGGGTGSIDFTHAKITAQ